MFNINDIKAGKNIVLDGEPFSILYHEHSKTGRAGAVLRTRIKNLSTGAVLEKTFQGADKVGEADISKTKAQYLYSDQSGYSFMDSESYDQFTLPEKVLGGSADFLIEGTEITVLNFNGIPINIELPVKMKFKVIEAPPEIKGDTASGGGKTVTLETGMKVTTPFFVKAGDEIILNTQNGEYVSRV